MPDIGLIDFLLHPPVGTLEEVLDTRSPWTAGDHSISVTHTATPVADTYGLIVGATLVPLGWGYRIGYKDVSEGLDALTYIEPIAQVVVTHRLLSGAPIFTQVDNIDRRIQMVLWADALPSLIGLHVQPGVELDLYWLRAL